MKNFNKLAILLALIVGLCSPLHAELWMVPDEIDNIQTALEVSQPGDTVLVEEGIYLERLNFNGRDIVLGSMYLLEENPDYILNTVIDPDGAAGSVVTFSGGETAGAMLVGFTLRGGVAQNGGGISIANASPTLRDLVVTDCRAEFQGGGGMGGGIYSTGSPVIERVEILNCVAVYGAGIVLRDGRTTISELTVSGCEGTGIDRSPARCGGAMVLNGTYTFDKCRFTNNVSHGGGGGMYTATSTVTLVDCVIQNNRGVDASGNGGGLSFQNNSVIRMDRCLVTNNSATTNGGAITMYLARADIINCTISENSAGVSGGAIYQFTNCVVVSVNSIIAHNGEAGAITFSGGNATSFSAAFSCIPGGLDGIVTNGAGRVNWLDGNILDDPLLAGAQEGDFNLIPESPCIDAGVDFYEYEERLLVSISDEDYDGDMPDMGVFEYALNGVHEDDPVPVSPVMIEAWPNPFNAMLTIRYATGGLETAATRMGIYDINGREVANLLGSTGVSAGQGFHPAAEGGATANKVTWDAGVSPAGVYLIKTQHNGEVISKSVMLVK